MRPRFKRPAQWDIGAKCLSDLMGVFYEGRILAHFEEMRVDDPIRFQGMFERGDKVVNMHFDARGLDAKRAIVAIGGIKQRYKDLGYAGMYGDTPNTRLARFFEKHGATIMSSPEDVRAEVKNQYMRGVREGGYPQENMENEVQRVVLRFDCQKGGKGLIRPANPDETKKIKIMHLKWRAIDEAELMPFGGKSDLESD